MPPLPALHAKEVIKSLEYFGFNFIRQRGSHKIYRKGSKMVVIPCHNKELKRGTLKSIITQSGIDSTLFLDHLK